MQDSTGIELQPTPWKTVLVEGQSLLRELLANVLEADPRFALLGELADPQEARRLCRSTWPDLLITEVDLPRKGALDLIAEVARYFPATRILVLSHLTDPCLLARLCELGIHGFVEKDQSLEILLEAAVEVAAGQRYFTATACRMQEQLRTRPKAASTQLTLTERNVLRLVAAGLTSRVIAQQLHLTQRSVETYRYRLARKLGVVGTAGLVRFALGALPDAPDAGYPELPATERSPIASTA